MLMLFISNQLAVAWDKFSDMAAGWLSAWGHHGEDQKRSFGHCSSLQSLVSILRLEPAQFLHHTGSFVGYLTDIAIEIGSLVMPSHSTMITTLLNDFWLHIDLWLNYWAWQLLDDCFMFPRGLVKCCQVERSGCPSRTSGMPWRPPTWDVWLSC